MRRIQEREEERSVFLLVSGDRGPIPQIVDFFLSAGKDLSLIAFSAPYRGNVETHQMETNLISMDQLGRS